MFEKESKTVDLKREYRQDFHLLTSDKAGWNGIDFIYQLESAGEVPESRLDRHMLLVFLEDVRASFMTNGNWHDRDYTEGDIAIIPAYELLPKTRVDRQFKLIGLSLEPATLDRAVGESADADKIELIPQLKLRDPLIQQIGLALKRELEAIGADSKLYAESMAIALSVHLLQRYGTRKQKIREYTGGLPKYKLKRVISYVEEYCDRSLTLAELAGLVQMSPHYFSSLFKQSTGLTPHQYVTKYRIEKARQLLAKSELTIVEISYLVGFQNQSHFTRVFRKFTKTTPKAYRDAL